MPGSNDFARSWQGRGVDAIEVEHALAKLDDGTYGLCEGCNQPIPEARLEAKPAARHCIDCASKSH